MEQPHGFEQDISLVCRLLKALYGLKQSPRQWYKHLEAILAQLGFKLVANQVIFKHTQRKIIILGYVDDLLIFGPNILEINSLYKRLEKLLKITDLGEVKFFLGMEIQRDRAKNLLFLS